MELKHPTAYQPVAIDSDTDAIKEITITPRRYSLSVQLLFLSAFVILVIEVLIFVPSLGGFHNQWLQDKLNDSAIIVVSFENAPSRTLIPDTIQSILDDVGVDNISFESAGLSEIIGDGTAITRVSNTIDLDEISTLGAAWNAANIAFLSSDNTLLVTGTPSINSVDNVTITLPVNHIKSDILSFGLRILALALLIAIVTATIIYLAVFWRAVLPIKKITTHLANFAKTPDVTKPIKNSTRRDEIGSITSAINGMEQEVQAAFKHKEHLASLGLAISKINHDLRNILTSTLLVSDRLVELEDPLVRKLAPRLVTSIDRAIDYCNDILTFGRARDVNVKSERIDLHSLLDEVSFDLSLNQKEDINWHNNIPDDLILTIDPDLSYRVFSNLIKNALEALQTDDSKSKNSNRKHIGVYFDKSEEWLDIMVADSGSGIPEQDKQQLFTAFSTKGKQNGTGLGLAIAKELTEAQGGQLMLMECSDKMKQCDLSHYTGAIFQLRFPSDYAIS